MHYRLFLDSNIYIGEGYSFRGSKFSKIKELVDDGTVTLVTNDIVEHEVRAHIEQDLRKSVPALAKAYKNRSLAFFKTNGYLNVTEDVVADNWIAACRQAYGLYLGECHADNAHSDKIDGARIKEAYLSEQVPFTKDKPNEFKDAFILTELADDIIYSTQPGELLYCVISHDVGFREGLMRILNTMATADIIESVCVYESLGDFCDEMTQLDKQGAFLKTYMAGKSHQESIKKHIAQLIEAADFDFADDDYYDFIRLGEAELLSVNNLAIDEDIIDVGTPTSKCAVVDIIVSAVVTIQYSLLDRRQSSWDIDGEFYPYFYEDIASYQVQFVLSELYNYENCVVPDDWQLGDAFDFGDMVMKIIASPTESLEIELSQDSRL